LIKESKNKIMLGWKVLEWTKEDEKYKVEIDVKGERR
jgi:hypothetical protein